MNKENGPINKWDSFSAFADCGVISVLSAASLCLILGSILMGGIAVYLVYITVPVHILAYTTIALLMFLFYWPRPESRVWKWQVALPLGFLLGIAPLMIMTIYDSDWLLMGGAHGVVSAIAALWVNKRRR